MNRFIFVRPRREVGLAFAIAASLSGVVLLASAHAASVNPSLLPQGPSLQAPIQSQRGAAVEMGGNSNPGVLPPGSHPYGASYDEWSERWWKWVLSIPAASNPLLDPTGQFATVGQSGPVWFLAGNIGGGVVANRCDSIGQGTLLPDRQRRDRRSLLPPRVRRQFDTGRMRPAPGQLREVRSRCSG
jgi:hypothetical protein